VVVSVVHVSLSHTTGRLHGYVHVPPRHSADDRLHAPADVLFAVVSIG
jgi:hypothetical protein